MALVKRRTLLKSIQDYFANEVDQLPEVYKSINVKDSPDPDYVDVKVIFDDDSGGKFAFKKLDFINLDFVRKKGNMYIYNPERELPDILDFGYEYIKNKDDKLIKLNEDNKNNFLQLYGSSSSSKELKEEEESSTSDEEPLIDLESVDNKLIAPGSEDIDDIESLHSHLEDKKPLGRITTDNNNKLMLSLLMLRDDGRLLESDRIDLSNDLDKLVSKNKNPTKDDITSLIKKRLKAESSATEFKKSKVVGKTTSRTKEMANITKALKKLGIV